LNPNSKSLLLYVKICSCLLITTTSQAAVLQVQNLDDTGLGSLRAAIESAEPGDTIRFSPSLNDQTIALDTGQLTIRKTLTIDATDLGDGIAIDAGNLSRILFVNDNDPEILQEVTIQGVSFRNGEVEFDDGGGVDNYENLHLIDCSFENNKASNGGGLRIRENSRATLVNCRFSGNSVSLAGGGVYCESSQTYFEKCEFESNQANTGGGIYNRNSDSTLAQCSFETNNAAGGASIYNVASNPIILGCSFNGGAAAFGGALYNTGSSPAILNCTFALNRSSVFGGALYNSSESNPTLINCSLAAHSSGPESGVIHNIDSSTTAINCIIWSQSIPVSGMPLSAESNHNLIEGIEGADDPQFTRSPDFVTKDYGDLTLSPESSAIDAGNHDAYLAASGPNQDLRGYIRLWDSPAIPNVGSGSITYLDLGAFEFIPLSGPPTITLVGESDLKIYFGVTWVDPGANTLDGFGGSPDLVVSGETVDTALPGVYIVTYDTIDQIGIPAIQVTRRVTVRNRTPLHDWATANGVSFDSLAFDEQDTPRSLSYLEKFAFGLGPEAQSTPIEIENATIASLGPPRSQLIAISNPPRIHYHLPRRKNAESLGLTYSVETSEDLTSWNRIQQEGTVTASSPDIEVVRFDLPLSSSPCFVRTSIAFEQ